MTMGRQSARAILIDDSDHLLLIRRTKPGQEPYWTTPGGGVEDTDPSLEAALHRELAEELGAHASITSRAFLCSSTATDRDIAIQHFFLARPIRLEIDDRSGSEFTDAARGGYDLDRIDLRNDDLASVDLKPSELRNFVLANREALLQEAAATASEHDRA